MGIILGLGLSQGMLLCIILRLCLGIDIDLCLGMSLGIVKNCIGLSLWLGLCLGLGLRLRHYLGLGINCRILYLIQARKLRNI